MRFTALALALTLGANAWAHDKDDRADRAPATNSPAVAAHPRLNVIAPAPEFALRDPAGDLVRLSEMRGKVVLVAFIYTSCTTTCPILGAQMARLQKRMKGDKHLRDGVMMLSVTVDPARDSSAVLARYASNLGADPAQWKFLRETPEALAPTLAGYHEWTKPMANGELDHPARIHLIDGEGQVREIYSLAFFDPQQVLVDIRSLAGSR